MKFNISKYREIKTVLVDNEPREARIGGKLYTMTKPKLLKLLALPGRWMIAVFGSLGVALLLMVLAGVFEEKVPEGRAEIVREIPHDSKVVAVRLLRRPRFESAVGAIEPIHQSSVAAKILAKVLEVNASAGQRVKAGDILVRLSDEDLQSRLKQAEAQSSAAIAEAKQARADFNRAQRLIDSNAMSRADYENASTAVETREAEVERASRAIEEARVLLDYATIKAPYDGVIVDKQVQQGDTVTPGQTLLTLYDPDQMQLVTSVRESLATKLKVGQQVPALLESLDHQCLATVREVVPQADLGSHSFQVKVSGPCPPGIYSGMFGRILLPLEDEELVVIPSNAIYRVGQLTLVDVVEQKNEFVRRNVQLGRQLDDEVEVLSGLKPGELVVVRNGVSQ